MSELEDVAAANIKPSSGKCLPAKQLPISLVQADTNSSLEFFDMSEKWNKCN